MKKQNKADIFKSFEQLKADVFPNLVSQERSKSSNLSPSQIGTCLADEAIEELLNQQKRKNA